MFISSLEMMRDKTLSQKVKEWGAALNVAAKSSGAKVFALNGPANLQVRLRKGNPQSYNFMGGETFRISSVVIDRDMAQDGIKIAVIFNPADLKLASDFASLTLPLSDAIDHFAELEEWARVAMLETDEKATAKAAERAHEAKVMASIPSVEETRSSEIWGAW